ncbi:MAG: histidine kinase [Aequorivita antarctica]
MLPKNKDAENTSDEIAANLSEEIAQLQLKAFSTQMNPHFVFNALAAVQYFITSGDKKASLFYLSVFSKLIRYYLKQIGKNSVLLIEEIGMINAYLTLQKLRYKNQFDYHIHPNLEIAKNASIPPFILQNLFENIIEHAIHNQYKNYRMEVTFETSPKKVIALINFSYEEGSGKTINYIPDYRKQLIKWQEQIRQHNSCKNYSIKKKITFNKNYDGKGGKISLSLPNLSK